jgi:peptidoglycan/xylan/chitin deacetylase (PgdA/CDA1 family)
VDAQYAASAAELHRARPLRYRARTTLRRVALTGLTALPRRRTGGLRIVHYHYVFDDELPSFAHQLELLRHEFEPVGLGEAVERLRDRRATGREVVVTFDDGFRTQAVNAAPLLAEAGFRACFFVITELLSASRDAVARICRDRLHLPRPVEPMGWDDVERLLELGHEVGSHTRSHPDLSALNGPALREELETSKEELERRLGRRVHHLSAPYGDAARFSPAVSQAAQAAGYESCATARRGANLPGQDVYALRRDHLVAGWPLRDLRWFLS